MRYKGSYIVAHESEVYHLHDLERGIGTSLCGNVYATEHENELTTTWAYSDRPRPLVVDSKPDGKRLCANCQRTEFTWGGFTGAAR